MNKYKIVVSSEFLTDTTTDEFISLFNDKLATLFIFYEQQMIKGWNNTKYVV